MDPACTFLGGGEILPSPRWRMASHMHPFHELVIVLKGRLLLRAANQILQADAGELFFYRAGLAHEESSDPSSPAHTYFIAFRCSEALCQDLPLRARDADGRLRQMASWLLQDHLLGAPHSQHGPILHALLHELRRLPFHDRDPWVRSLRQYMRRHLSQEIRLDDLARHAGISKFTLVRRFKRATGRTPMQDLRLMRLNEARARILSSQAPIREIAPAVGLGDEYQLSKLFRRHFHLSPREMRVRSR